MSTTGGEVVEVELANVRTVRTSESVSVTFSVHDHILVEVLAVDSTVERTVVAFKTPRWHAGYHSVSIGITGSSAWTVETVLNFVAVAAPTLVSVALPAFWLRDWLRRSAAGEWLPKH